VGMQLARYDTKILKSSLLICPWLWPLSPDIYYCAIVFMYFSGDCGVFCLIRETKGNIMDHVD